jgi:chromosome segregation ATPase
MDLESRVIEDSTKIKELTDEIYSLKSNRTSLNSEVEKYEDLLKDNNQIIDDNYKKIYKLGDEISELNNQINFLKKIKYDYEEVLKSNDDELSSYYNDNKALKIEVDKFKSKTLNLIKELEVERSKSEEYLL